MMKSARRGIKRGEDDSFVALCRVELNQVGLRFGWSGWHEGGMVDENCGGGQ